MLGCALNAEVASQEFAASLTDLDLELHSTFI